MRIVALVLAVTASACFFKPDPPSEMMIPPGGSDAALFAVGDHHACLIDSSQQLWCWGDNRSGQLGPGATDPYTGTPVQVMPGSTWKSVAAGRAHTCALSTDDTIYCWGANNVKQVDGGTAAPKLGITPVDLDNSNLTPAEIYAGADASCTITTDARLYCWGRYQPPQATGYGVTPVEPGGMLADAPHQGWFQVAISDTHVCALNDFGDVACWGDDSRLQLGDPSANNHDVSQAYIYPDKLKVIAVGSFGTCGIALDDTFECFGHATITNGNDDNPHAVIDTRPDWKMVAVGEDHVCGIRGEDGQVFCYGGDGLSQLGDDFQNIGQLPSNPLTSGATGIFASHGWTCEMKTDGVHCWGSNQFGEAGNTQVPTAHHRFPTINTGTKIENITAGPTHACAVLTNGEVDCWGANGQNQILPGSVPFYVGATKANQTAFVIPGTRLITAGDGHTCVRESGNLLECWGDNNESQLGKTVPFLPNAVGIDAGGSEVWIDISAGGHSTCATVSGATSMGDVWCWGDFGNGAIANKLKAGIVAVSVGDVAAVFAGGPTPNNAVYATTGQSCFDMATPVAAAGGPIRQVASSQLGEGHACAEAGDGVSTNVLTCWGANGYSQVTASASDCVEPTPVMFPGSLQVKDWNSATRPNIISVAGNHTCAITESPQSLLCWGDNASEALGDANAASDVVTSPMNVTTDTSQWYEVATGATYTCAITMDQMKVYCWGLNERGQIGNGQRFPSAPPKDPVTIPGM